MKKTFIRRALLGIPLGVTIGYAISIIFSLIYAEGYYGSVHPDLIVTFGNEINATIVQAVLWGLIGFIFSGFSVIFENDNFSILKQTFIVFFVYLTTLLVVGNILKWYELNINQVIIFVLIFVIIFFIIWLFMYLTAKKDVNALNKKINNG